MMRVLKSIIWRELLRFLHQKERFFSALVRPLVWLFIFGAGFRAALGLAISPPYETYIRYETYILPGLCAMIILFNAMQSALSIVYDREMGSMRLLLTSPMPRYWILFCKLIASSIVSICQCYVFLMIAAIYGALSGQGGLFLPPMGYLVVFPAFVISGLMLGSFGLYISSVVTRLQNFAGVMNFVIFPMFFASTALYPLWRIQENAPMLAMIVRYNPFTYVVELIRFALYSKLNVMSLIWVVFFTVIMFALAVQGYQQSRGMFSQKEK